ncbi:unnamed protein product [Owenia fusiformis]|uniref:Uncharacterized protein n=1 Tax=Owenia fusiformis TaxID=6347 RepID=A0A8S4PIK6_OWEFU|nr:unnamed protein product [Owenia fusiformis]
MHDMKRHFCLFWLCQYFIAFVRSTNSIQDKGISTQSPTQKVIKTKAAIDASTTQQEPGNEEEVQTATTVISTKSVTAYKYSLMHLQCNEIDCVIEIKSVSSWNKDHPEDKHFSENHGKSRFKLLEEYCNGYADCSSINARPEYGDMEHIIYDCVPRGKIKNEGTSPTSIKMTTVKVTVSENPVTTHQVTRTELESGATQLVTKKNQPESTKSVTSKTTLIYSVMAYENSLVDLSCEDEDHVIKIKAVHSWNKKSPQLVYFSDNRGGSQFRQIKERCNGQPYCQSVKARPEYGDMEQILYECIPKKASATMTTSIPKKTVTIVIAEILALQTARPTGNAKKHVPSADLTREFTLNSLLGRFPVNVPHSCHGCNPYYAKEA